MTISERRASTVFDRFNFTITDIISLSDPKPTDYTPEDFFHFYQIVFAVDENQLNYTSTIQFLFLFSMASFLIQQVTEKASDLSRLREFLATPLLMFNEVEYGGPTFNMGKSVSLAIPSYRVPLIICTRLTHSVDHCSVYSLFVHDRWLYFLDLVFSGIFSYIKGANPKFVTIPRN